MMGGRVHGGAFHPRENQRTSDQMQGEQVVPPVLNILEPGQSKPEGAF